MYSLIGTWCDNLDVAVKVMLFQNTTTPSSNSSTGMEQMQQQGPSLGVFGGKAARQRVLREAAVCCSVSHPNVVATYHYEVLQATAYQLAPSGLTIQDSSDEKSFKLYLIQVNLRVYFKGEVRAI